MTVGQLIVDTIIENKELMKEINDNIIDEEHLKDVEEKILEKEIEEEQKIEEEEEIVIPENAQFERLKNNPDYEIMTSEPYYLRKISTKRIVKESQKNKENKYISIKLNGQKKLKHRIIAEHFVPNDDPENKKLVDHIDNNIKNNSPSNLRWVSNSDNQKNRISTMNIVYQFLDKLPPDSILVKKYNSSTFENYFYSNGEFYFFNGEKYRKLEKLQRSKRKALYVNAINTKGKRTLIFVNKFEREYINKK
ncbi:hypothetical protein M9Y10_004689 [Tritrichomonas musculus]|uniref:HNH nuclease domain-containing protein n=1 Tax=Tritrichomonas musculus TaxID=1915356 RepID=A0ABR2JJP6_9EUKA